MWSGCAALRLSVCPAPFSSFLLASGCAFVVGWRFPPSVFIFLGGVSLFLPPAFLGLCTHWSAFCVANWFAVGVVGGCGRAPAPWVGWVIYTLELGACPVELDAGSASWAVAPVGFVRSWVSGGGVAPCFPAPAVPV